MANFLDIIKGEGRAVEFIKSLVEQGVKSTQILNQLRDAGLGIRNQTGYQVINYLREVHVPGQNAIKDIAETAFPSISDIPKSVTNLLRNFSYRIRITGENQFTGQVETRYIQLSTNQLLTRQQAIQTANAITATDNVKYPLNGGIVDLHELTQNSAGLTDTTGLLSDQLTPSEPSSGSYIPPGYGSIADYYRDIS